MELIMQPTCFTCGQACIAMIAGKSVDEVIIDMKTDGATSIGQLIEILDFYGIRHAEKNKLAYRALQKLQKESVGTDCVYPYMDKLDGWKITSGLMYTEV